MEDSIDQIRNHKLRLLFSLNKLDVDLLSKIIKKDEYDINLIIEGKEHLSVNSIERICSYFYIKYGDFFLDDEEFLKKVDERNYYIKKKYLTLSIFYFHCMVSFIAFPLIFYFFNFKNKDKVSSDLLSSSFFQMIILISLSGLFLAIFILCILNFFRIKKQDFKNVSLKKVRNEYSLSQREVGMMLGYSLEWVCKKEKTNDILSKKEIYLISKKLKITPDRFVNKNKKYFSFKQSMKIILMIFITYLISFVIISSIFVIVI